MLETPTDLPQPPTAVAAASPVAEQRRAMLAEFGLMTEQDLAALLGLTVKTLLNRPFADLPEFTTAGRERLYFKASVVTFLRGRMKPVRRRGMR
jgi:hypothetical protein